MIKTGTSKYAGIWGKAVHINHVPHCHQRDPFHSALHKHFKPHFQIALLQGSLPSHDCRLISVRAGGEDGLCGSFYPGCLHT